MFAYPSYQRQQPRSALATPSFFPVSTPLSFDEYDAQRSAREQALLVLKQRQRRQAEEDAILARASAKRRQEAVDAAYQELVLQQEQERRRAVELVAARKQQQAYLRAQQAAEVEYLRREEARQAWIARQQQARQQQVDQEAGFNPYEFLASLIQSSSLATPPSAQTSSPSPPPKPIASSSTVPIAQPTSTSTSAPTAPSHTCGRHTPEPATYQLVFDFGSSPSPPSSSETPAAAPIPTPTSSTAPEVDASAAATLQKHYRAHLKRRQLLSSIASLSDTLDAHQSTFVLPSTLVFTTPSDKSSPKLAYSHINAPFLAHEDFLVGLLQKADEIQSGGDRVVKAARKELVKRVETELAKLDAKKESDLKEFVVVGTSDSKVEATPNAAEDDVSGESVTSFPVFPVRF